MPGNHGFWLHDHQGRPPASPDPGQPRPEDAICCPQLRSPLGGPLKDADLVAQREDLELKGCAAAKPSEKEREERRNHDGGRESVREAQSPLYQPDPNLREPQG